MTATGFYCAECDDIHTTRFHCPKCGACDYSANVAGVQQCWNCDHVTVL